MTAQTIATGVALVGVVLIAAILLSKRDTSSKDGFRPESNLNMNPSRGVDDSWVGEPVAPAAPPTHSYLSRHRGCIGCGPAPCEELHCRPRRPYTPPPRAPPPPPCRAPPMTEPCREAPRATCDSAAKARGDQRCPGDLCRGSWCWSPATVEQAEGLTAAGAIGFEPDVAGRDNRLHEIFDAPV